MPTYFIMDALEDGYSFRDFETEGVLEEYIVDILEIPLEVVESLELTKKQEIELVLRNETWVMDEDWYYYLVKSSKNNL